MMATFLMLEMLQTLDTSKHSLLTLHSLQGLYCSSDACEQHSVC